MTPLPISTSHPRISVVIPTCNRPDLLARCLAALLRQDFEPADYEIIVVDDGPHAATRRVVETVRAEAQRAAAETAMSAADAAHVSAAMHPAQAAPARGAAGSAGSPPAAALSIHHSLYAVRRPPAAIRYLPNESVHGPAAARNVGWRAAVGEIIAFTDDDCLPAPGWLRAGLEALGEPLAREAAPAQGPEGETGRIVGASGQVVVPLPFTPTDHELNMAGVQRSEFVTANCFYRREALAAAGGFDERFTAAWREDTDLFFTLLTRYGDRLTCAPRAIVFHPVRPARWGVSLRQQRRRVYDALLYKKHPQLYRQRLADPTPRRYDTIVAALLAAALAALAGQWSAAAAAGLVWLLLTLRFCLLRLRGVSHAPRHVLEMVVTSALIPPLSVFWRLVGAVRYRVWFVHV